MTRLPEYLHACLFALSVFIKAACCSLNSLCFLSSSLVFFPDSLSLVVVSSYLLSCLPGFVWQASCCFPPHLLWWPLTAHLSFSPGIFSPLPGEFFISSKLLYLCLPVLLPAAVLSQSSPSLLSFSVTPLLLLLSCFLFALCRLPPLPTPQPRLLVVFPTVSHLSLPHFTLLLSPLPDASPLFTLPLLFHACFSLSYF